MPIPNDSEKNIWPPAEARTLMKPEPLNTSQFGLNINSRPAPAPGSVTLLMMTMTRKRNNAGIAIFVNFSIPSDTPPLTIKVVKAMKIKVKTTLSI